MATPLWTFSFNVDNVQKMTLQTVITTKEQPVIQPVNIQLNSHYNNNSVIHLLNRNA